MDNVTGLNIQGLTFQLQLNVQENLSSLLVFLYSRVVVISDSVFQRDNTNGASGRAINSTGSHISITNSHFEDNTGSDGGAITAQEGSVLNLSGNTFTRNQATGYGGAIYAHNTTLTLERNNFSHNMASRSGGAIYSNGTGLATHVALIDQNNFYDNLASGNDYSSGGAIGMTTSVLSFSGSAVFSQNRAVNGGAVYMENAVIARFTNGSILFDNNTADYRGGGIFFGNSSNVPEGYSPFYTKNSNLTFVGNTARDLGPLEACGTLCIFNSRQNAIKEICNMSATLRNNSGVSGGAAYIAGGFGFTLYNITAENNADGAVGIKSARVTFVGANHFSRNSNLMKDAGTVTIEGSLVFFSGTNIFDSNVAYSGTIMVVNGSHIINGQKTSESIVEFTGSSTFESNIGVFYGGGVSSKRSILRFKGVCSFLDNMAPKGAGMFADRGTIEFSRRSVTNFVGNTATRLGGGLSASGTNIRINSELNFSRNYAMLSGGAIYLELLASLEFNVSGRLTSSFNSAMEYGGAIFHKDSLTSIQCTNVSDMISQPSLSLAVPLSFLQLTSPLNTPHMVIVSHWDVAGKDGSFLYGGLLDRSRLETVPNAITYDYLTSMSIWNISIAEETSRRNKIASDPFQLQFCNGEQHSCITVYRGQTFTLQIKATGQGGSVVPANISASFNSSARLTLGQSMQSIPGQCSNVSFNFFSSLDHELLTIYPKGPCETIGEQNLIANVTFEPCPEGFNQSGEVCVCENRLKQFNVSCQIDDQATILRFAGTRLWMNASYLADGSYEGLILSPSCPAEYCVAHSVSISLDQPDVQCAHNRSGVLCGQCAANFSLLLGGPQCARCSNTYLLLVLLFAVFGLALVVFLSLTRLTVATGTINSLILYANLVQVNKTVFFPSGHTNPLTVFVAWLNLDFGFQVCFFDGMDIFAQTLLQFAFSLYVWTLIFLIILSSRYSITVSKLIGSNPVAVLATLLLMSYNKILKVIIDVFSSVTLEYPNERRSVWLKDGSLEFLHSKHLFLSIFTLLLLILVFIPYTFFLLLGHLLYHLPERRCYNWLIMKLKPLLDSYYAPYMIKTQYWTGFLLLIRCVLYVIFSASSLSGTNYSLLAIIVTFTTLGSLNWIHRRLYEHFYIDVIEMSVYVNLMILSAAAASFSDQGTEITAYVSVGVVLFTAVCITLYQVHCYYLSKTRLWLRLKTKVCDGREEADDDGGRVLVEEEEQLNRVILLASPPDHDFREPLLV